MKRIRLKKSRTKNIGKNEKNPCASQKIVLSDKKNKEFFKIV
jgi:hypothetical protein